MPLVACYSRTGSTSARWRPSHSSTSSRIISTLRCGAHPAPAAQVVAVPGMPIETGDLKSDQIEQICDMQHVAHLAALAAEADVAQRPPVEMTGGPQHEEALIDLAHLPWAGDHAAAIDNRTQAEGSVVFLDQQLG